MDIKANKVYEELYDHVINKNKQYFYFLLAGSRSSGKSYAIKESLLLRALKHRTKIAIFRKFATTNRKSVFKDIKELINIYNIDAKINSQEMIITFNNGSEMLFLACDYAPEKLKSISGIELVFMEEAIEFSYNDYLQISALLRMKDADHKIIMAFNPDNKNSWIYKNFYEKEKADTYKLKTTFHNNAFLLQNYEERLKEDIGENKELAKSWLEGEWASQGDLVFDHYIISDVDPFEKHGIEFEYILGLDFGWKSPSSAVLSKINQSEKLIYTLDDVQVRGATTYEFIQKTNQMLESYNINKSDIFTYGDSASPEKIKEFEDDGYIAKLAKKKTDDSIEFIKKCSWYINPNATELIKELSNWCWAKDKNGDVLDKPIVGGDHSIDGVRYSAFTYQDGNMPGIVFI